ncbi:hypothetical protein EVG20_g6280 [Dentipellis fragilis]|uniref:Large ribosomal subunit protein mL49 n=1 Tax=Dentipellis fragilis TaxID=205917 RepID=A0A4Y9YR47_9AGAM|nr:hypothetical protein EVG20_g6280 [Dentipellis fragilis]
MSSFLRLLARTPTRAFSSSVPTAARAIKAAVPQDSLPVQYPYFVPRNTRGSLPVYSDVRNAGGRFLILIRNVEGNAHALAEDLKASLFTHGSPEAERMKINIVRSKHLILSGGRWKHDIMGWLQKKGF